MRHFPLPVAMCVGLAVVAAASLDTPARAQNVPTFSKQVVASRTWTNDDMDQVRAEAFITTFNPAQQAPGTTQQEQRPQTSVQPRPAAAQDPEWYAAQAVILEAKLEARQNALRKYLQAISDVKSLRHTTSAIALDQPSVGLTPEAGASILEAGVRETEAEIDDLAELARENGIAPGVLRG